MPFLWGQSSFRGFVKLQWLFFVPLGIMVLLFSLSPSVASLRRTFFGFDTFIEVELPKQHASLFSEIARLVRQYDTLWNRFASESLVARINTSHLWIPLDDETFFLLKEAFVLSEKTRGMFCPLVGGLMDLWGFPAGPRIPDPRDIERELQVIQESTIMFDEGRKAVIRIGDAKLDLGGIAKGYFVDLLAKFLKEKGVKRFLINAGGTVFGAGKTWEVGILHPRKEGLLGKIQVRDLCVSTSGDYFRFFEKNGKRYHHILNPKSGYPGETFVSVTVAAPQGILADVLSTAIMAGDEAFLSCVFMEFPEVAILAVRRDGSIVLSPRMRGLFSDE